MKRKCAILLTICLFILCPYQNINAWSSFHNELNSQSVGTIHAKTPIDINESGAAWKIKFKTNSSIAYNSQPIITDQFVFVVCDDVLYQLDKAGSEIKRLTLSSSMKYVSNMCFEDGMLYIPLKGGTIQCVDANTMASVWTSEAFGSQSLSTVYIRNGLLFAGTTNPAGTGAAFYCLNTTDGSTKWVYKDEENPFGYYWSGANSYESDVTKCILFGGDNGKLVSHAQADETVIDIFDVNTALGTSTKIRAGINYDASTDSYYTTTYNGYLLKIKMNEDGTFKSVDTTYIGSDSTLSASSTSTPTIVNGRLYVCGQVDSKGIVSVFNPSTMTLLYTASNSDCPDIKSSPLISTGYSTSENGNKVYVYFTSNSFPGGLYYIEDNSNSTNATIKTLYSPSQDCQQYCMSSVSADSEGTLYYSNDSGTLFAIKAGHFEPAPTPSPAPSITPCPSLPSGTSSAPPTSTPSSSTLKKALRKPKNIKIKYIRRKKKYKVTLTWKKPSGVKKTLIKINKKKYKLLSGTKKTLYLKKGTYQFEFYSYLNSKTKSAPVKKKLKLK